MSNKKAKAKALSALLEGLVGVGKAVARAASAPAQKAPESAQNGNLAGCCTAPGKAKGS